MRVLRDTVTCADCGWSLANDGEFDLYGERCGYRGCVGELRYSTDVLAPDEAERIRNALVPVVPSPADFKAATTFGIDPTDPGVCGLDAFLRGEEARPSVADEPGQDEK